MLVGLALCGCQLSGGDPAEAYRRWSDRMIVALGLTSVGMHTCKAEDEIDDCVKMLPKHRWQGLWVTEFEGDRFCPGTMKACSWEKQPRYELWFNRKVFTGRPQIKAEMYRVYALDFEGRRTQYKTDRWSPHYEIVVDHLIAMRDLGPMPEFEQRLRTIEVPAKK
jgi:hypothetical protein